MTLLAVSPEFDGDGGETAKVRWRPSRSDAFAFGGGGMTDVVLGGTAGDADEDDVDEG